MKNKSTSETSSLGAQIMMASELGSMIVVSCLAGYFGGNFLDTRLSSTPYGVVGGIMLGLTLGLVLVVKRSNQIEAKAKADKAARLLEQESEGQP